jgi:hypothetical protein
VEVYGLIVNGYMIHDVQPHTLDRTTSREAKERINNREFVIVANKNIPGKTRRAMRTINALIVSYSRCQCFHCKLKLVLMDIYLWASWQDACGRAYLPSLRSP